MKKYLLFLGLFFLVLLFYGKTFGTWFQQDEWDWIGRYVHYNATSKIPFWEAFKSSLFPHPRYRFTPLFDAAFAMEVKLFGLTFWPYVLVSLLVHTLNSFLVYKLTNRLTRNEGVSILAAIIFATSGIGQKAVTWVFTSTNTAVAASFSLLTVIVFLKFLEGKKKLWHVIGLLFISMWFKETAIILLAILPVIAVLKKGVGEFGKIFLYLGIYGFLYFLLRISLSQIGARIHTTGYPDFGVFLTISEYFQVFMWALPRALVDIFINPDSLRQIGRMLVPIFWESFRGMEQTTKFGLFTESHGVDLATIIFSPIVIFSFLKIKKVIPDQRKYKQAFYISIMFVVCSIIVTFLLSVRGKSALVRVFRSRDLYLSLVGSSILLAMFVRFSKNKLIGYLFLGLYFVYNWQFVNVGRIPIESKKAEVRMPIVNQIYSTYSILPKRVVFYTESDTPFYGSGTPSMPFQTGFGRTLLVWYTMKNNEIPTEFVKDDWLFYKFDQDYREIGEYGFGYFFDFDKLAKVVSENGLEDESVYAFRYFGETRELVDITSEIREKI